MMRMLSIGALFIVGCGTTKVVQYAEPLPKRVQAPLSVDLSDVSPPFLRKIDPVKAAELAVPDEPAKAPDDAPKSPRDVIREANREAYTVPEEGDTVGHTQVYVYDADREYPIYACAQETVQVRLAVGEKLIGEPAIWATEAVAGPDGKVKASRIWSQNSIISGDGHGKTIQVLLLRPNRGRLPRARMQMFTNVGPYTLELNVVSDEECMRAVRWRHPQHELNMLAIDAEQHEEVQTKAAAQGGDGCTSAAYDIEVMQGSPRWVPTMVWRECNGDRARVHIQFRGDVAWSKIPALQTDGGVANYDYDPSNKVMTIMGLFNHAKLQLGSKEQPNYEVVAIHALKEPHR
jgi:type IV secretory pathway VirB9-like protein